MSPFPARRKPTSPTPPNPLPLPSPTDLVVMGRHRISLTDWHNMTPEQRRHARLSVAHTGNQEGR